MQRRNWWGRCSPRFGYAIQILGGRERSDVIQAVRSGAAGRFKRSAGPSRPARRVGSYLDFRCPARLPGYGRELVMARGQLIDGSPVEFSRRCAPCGSPYVLFSQGTGSHTARRTGPGSGPSRRISPLDGGRTVP